MPSKKCRILTAVKQYTTVLKKVTFWTEFGNMFNNEAHKYGEHEVFRAMVAGCVTRRYGCIS
jgi:hypothetical protein